MQPSHRLLLAAVIFALVAVVLFVVVWKWPQFFRMAEDEMPLAEELSEEAKMDVLTQVRASNAGDAPPNADQNAVLEQVSESNTGPVPSTEEKMNILQTLHAAE